MLTYTPKANATAVAAKLPPIILIFALAVTLVWLSCPIWMPFSHMPLQQTTIRSEQGFAYVATVPTLNLAFPFIVPTDTLSSSSSNLQLREDGVLLGPAHAMHDDIRVLGHGRFSHWHDTLYFSTSDGTDPRSNGRAYTVSLQPAFMPGFSYTLLLADFAIFLLMRRRIFGYLTAHRRIFASASVIVLIALGGMLILGTFGVINPTGSPPEYPALVLSIAGHVLLACVIVLAQWMMGAGVARALLPKSGTSYAHIALLGYPLSLALLALNAVVILVFPYGWAGALLLWITCLVPLFLWPLGRTHILRCLKPLPGLLAVSFAFGCWMSLLWHGPTEIVPGAASGDQIFYSSAVWAIAAHPIGVGWPNLAVEGETYSYLNSLFPLVGAAILRLCPIDSFLFVCSASAMAVLATGLAIQAYLTERPIPRAMRLELLLLILAFVAAGHSPTWIVTSPPVALLVPLIISIWFWATQVHRAAMASRIAILLSVLGSALSKVVSIATLAPIAIAAAISHFHPTRRALLFGLVIILPIGCYVLWIMITFVPFFADMIRSGTINLGPRSYDLIANRGYSVASAWPFLAQDVGIVVVAIVAVRVMEWSKSWAVVAGLSLVLIYPFLTWANFMCAVLIATFAFIEDPKRPPYLRYVMLVALPLVALPMILRDEAGLASGLVWPIIIASLVLVAFDAAVPNWTPRLHLYVTSIILFATITLLISTATGTLVINAGWPDADVISPQVRDIWIAVRGRVPNNGLIFTDQTGRDPGFLSGWNTYVLNGQRQVYMASWYQSVHLRTDPIAREARIRLNESVLSGIISPKEVRTSREYGSFFAVVALRRHLSDDWKLIYSNEDYALYKWSARE
jgi:hypothetical protein